MSVSILYVTWVYVGIREIHREMVQIAVDKEVFE